MSDEAVPIVEVEDEGDVLLAMPEQVGTNRGRGCRIVDPAGKAEACLAHGVRVDGRLAGSPGQRPKEGVDGRDLGH